MESNERYHVRDFLEFALLDLLQIDTLEDLTDVALVAHLSTIGIVFEQVADDLVRLEHVRLVRRPQHQLEDLVEKECINEVPTAVQSVASLHRHVSNHEAPIVLEG